MKDFAERDVGEGWRRLLPEDVMQEGDEVDVGRGEEKWVPTACPGKQLGRACDSARYRRRKTPDVASIAASEQLSASCGTLREENKRLRSEVERLRLEPSLQEEIVAWSVDLHDARQENKRLTAEVERLRDLVRHQRGELYEADLISDKEYANLVVTDGKASVARLHTYDDLRFENVKLKAEVERLRLRPEEMDALSWCRDVLPRMWEPCAVVQIHSEVCGKMLKRLIGGGE